MFFSTERFRRLIGIDRKLQPAKGLALVSREARCTVWRMEDTDPQFLVKLGGWLRPGLYRLRLVLADGYDALVSPVIYYDDGSGFSASHALPLEFRRDGVGASAIFELPATARAIRFDPSVAPGLLKTVGFDLWRISTRIWRMEMAIKALRQRVRSHQDAQRLARRFWTLLRGGHLAELERLLRYAAEEQYRVEGTVASGLSAASFGIELPETLSPYQSWLAVNEPTAHDYNDLRRRLATHAAALPKVSVVVPVYNTPIELLDEMVASVRAQVYENWELCLADDASPSPHIAEKLDALCNSDPRIKTVRLPRNGGISEATNAAAELSGGEVLAFVDHDDLITPDCLAELALYYAEHPEADIVYSDDDKLGTTGERHSPQFKPDWSPVLLLSFMYISHIFSLRRELFARIGGCRKQFDGSQDYDLALRASEQARHIGHIPKILYHWRAVEGSTATGGDAKPASFEAGRLAVEQAFARRGTVADIRHPEWALAGNCGIFEPEFPHHGPHVTIIVANRNKRSLLERCMRSLRTTTYTNYDIMVADNQSDDARTLTYLAQLRDEPDTSVVSIASPPAGFSFANLNNEAAKLARGKYVLFLNNDTEVISPGWLSQMVGYAEMAGVGAVGARLYFEDHTIQHAGVLHVGRAQLAAHAFRHASNSSWGYMNFIRVAREYSAETAACMLTPRELFLSMGGFDEQRFAVAYNDVDYCYRLVEAGYRTVYCATAELYHYEGKTRGYQDNPREEHNFRVAYGDWYDRWYNPNLSLDSHHLFEPTRWRPPRALGRPVQTTVFTHNLHREGAPLVLFDLVRGLQEQGIIEARVVSPEDGHLHEDYRQQGVEVSLLPAPLREPDSTEGLARSLDALAEQMKAWGTEVVLANTLNTFWAVAAARHAGLPAIWCQHESEPWQTYFNYLSAVPRAAAYRAFHDAFKVTYVADATRRAWSPLNTAHNFELIPYALPPAALEEKVANHNRAEARHSLGFADDDFVVTIVGTICERKGQLDLIRAVSLLSPRLDSRIRVVIVGKDGQDGHLQAMRAEIGRLPQAVQDRIILPGATNDPFRYYVASDVYVCTSRIESAPRVLIEAMACGLPIVTTPVFGIPELVKPGLNALYYGPGQVTELAKALEQLYFDEALRRRLATTSPMVLQSRPGYAAMLDRYSSLIRQAAALTPV